MRYSAFGDNAEWFGEVTNFEQLMANNLWQVECNVSALMLHCHWLQYWGKKGCTGGNYEKIIQK